MESSVFFCLQTLLLCLELVGGCQFPQFTQYRSGGGGFREWHSRIVGSGGYTDIHATVTRVYSNEIRTFTYSGDGLAQPILHTLHCILKRNGRFLAQRRQQGKPRKYMCVDFIKRSDYVMQLLQSNLSDVEDPSLCNDESEMALDKWPYVNRANLFNSYDSCPLNGGYNISMFDKMEQKDLCDVYKGHTRLEIACHKGEGSSMHFLFREQNCIPPNLNMEIDQQLYCMGSWQQDQYIFTVLRHDKTEHFWCFRFPVGGHDRFPAVLFRDLYCDTEFIPDTNAYVAIYMFKESAWGMTNLCENDYELCDIAGDPCVKEGSPKQLMCAKRCGVCTAERPERCVIPEKFRGNWTGEGPIKNAVTVGSSGVTIGHKLHLQCVDWSNENSQLAIPDYLEQMFVTTFSNGCKPRYTCIQFKTHSPSVLRIRLSEWQTWPFRGTSGRVVDCAGFYYVTPHVTDEGEFRSSHFNTLISDVRTEYVDCELRRTRYFSMMFDDGVKCTGSLTQEGMRTSTKMKLVLDGCPGKQAEQIYACMDSESRPFSPKQMIITETLDTEYRIACWFFPQHPDNVFYLIPVFECNEAANERLNGPFLKPIASFRDLPHVSIAIHDEEDNGEVPVQAITKTKNSPVSQINWITFGTESDASGSHEQENTSTKHSTSSSSGNKDRKGTKTNVQRDTGSEFLPEEHATSSSRQTKIASVICTALVVCVSTAMT